MPTSVTWDQVTAFRLLRHHLSERASPRALVSVARDMGGAQAQLFSAARLSLATRVQGLQIEQIDRALRERRLVKAAGVRRTLFLVPADQLAIFVRGSTGRAQREINWALGKGVSQRDLDAAIEAALAALDEPLTRPEIAERVSRALRVRTRAVHGGGWGRRAKLAAVPVGHLHYPVVDLLHLSASRGVVCYGPSRGVEPTFVRADAWIPDWHDLSVEEAEDLLLRRYLQSYGPATPADFSMWSGITLKGARAIWARLAGERSGLAAVNVEGWDAALLRADLGTLQRAAFDRPLVRLLPYFDSYLLGHGQREHLVGRKHYPRIYRPQGWIAPVLLVDGRVNGVWEYARQGQRLRVKVTKFAPLAPRVAAGVRAEARELGRFLGVPDVEVQIG